jgi:hypothetical protein
MLTRRIFCSGAACFALAATNMASAAAPDESARAFVAAIYETYKGKNGNGITLDTESDLRRYFEPSLAALISKDQKDAAKRNDVPTLDGDPFVDAQDWEIAEVKISVGDTNAGKAQATVNFENAGQPTTIVLDLVKIKTDWRISDITWQHDGKPETLRGLYKH